MLPEQSSMYRLVDKPAWYMPRVVRQRKGRISRWQAAVPNGNRAAPLMRYPLVYIKRSPSTITAWMDKEDGAQEPSTAKDLGPEQ